MNAKRDLFILFTVVLLALTPWTEALAKELIKITIAGPGLEGEIEVIDPEAIQLFSNVQYDGQIDNVPSQLPSAYFEIHQVLGHAEEIIATNIFHYYPSLDGESGYFYYADVRGGWSSAEGTWFVLTEPSDRALRAYLDMLGASSELVGTGRLAQEQPQLYDVLGLFYRFAKVMLSR